MNYSYIENSIIHYRWTEENKYNNWWIYLILFKILQQSSIIYYDFECIENNISIVPSIPRKYNINYLSAYVTVKTMCLFNMCFNT